MARGRKKRMSPMIDITDKEKELLKRIREAPAYSKITFEKRDDKVYRCVVEASFMIVDSKN